MKFFNPLRSTFLLLSLVSSMVELGPIVMLLIGGSSLAVALAAGLAYQTGNLIAGLIRISLKWIVICGTIALVFTWVMSSHILFLYTSILLTSIFLQELRRFLTDVYKNEVAVSTLLKRSVRIIGFAAAGLLNYQNYPWLIFILCLIGFGIFFWKQNARHLKQLSSHNSINPLALIMVVHQSHYFSYAYLIPMLFISIFNIPKEMIGVLFVLGWVSYASVESLVRYDKMVAIFVAGHILVAISLIVLGVYAESLTLALLAWFTSGLGGGTVFCLTRLNKSIKTNGVEMDIWEDIGHVTGILIALCLTAIPIEPFTKMFFVSSIIAICTASAMIISNNWIRKTLPHYS